MGLLMDDFECIFLFFFFPLKDLSKTFYVITFELCFSWSASTYLSQRPVSHLVVNSLEGRMIACIQTIHASPSDLRCTESHYFN